VRRHGNFLTVELGFGDNSLRDQNHHRVKGVEIEESVDRSDEFYKQIVGEIITEASLKLPTLFSFVKACSLKLH
jgi:hypothetical protein